MCVGELRYFIFVLRWRVSCRHFGPNSLVCTSLKSAQLARFSGCVHSPMDLSTFLLPHSRGCSKSSASWRWNIVLHVLMVLTTRQLLPHADSVVHNWLKPLSDIHWLPNGRMFVLTTLLWWPNIIVTYSFNSFNARRSIASCTLSREKRQKTMWLGFKSFFNIFFRLQTCNCQLGVSFLFSFLMKAQGSSDYNNYSHCNGTMMS